MSAYNRLDESRTYRDRSNGGNSAPIGGRLSASVSSMPSLDPSVVFSRGKISLRVCGPKMSLCCLCLSAWGILQLVFMGLAMQSRSVAFVEDLRLEDKYRSADDLRDDMDKQYEKGAYNCYVAAMLYVVTLVVSGFQYWLNQRTAPNGYQRYG